MVYIELVECGLDRDKWIKVLSETGRDVRVVDASNRNALHWAADEGNAAAVVMLVESGLDVNSQDNELMTPLHYAALCGHREVNTLGESVHTV